MSLVAATIDETREAVSTERRCGSARAASLSDVPSSEMDVVGSQVSVYAADVMGQARLPGAIDVAV
jgi:hypothetical protein